jgi:hypothetical protein
MLKVYVDESGTNDITGRQPGSSVPCFCGYIETPDYWKGFCREWRKVLNNYRAPYFHFREFANKHLYSKASSPYYGWSEKKRDKFLYDLAFLAGEAAVPVGGYYNAKQHHMLGLKGDSFQNAIIMLFEDLIVALEARWPRFDGKMLFVFDQCEDRSRVASIQNTHALFLKRDPRLDGGLTFENDKDPLHLALQAADLYAYASRQYVERQMANPSAIEPPRLLDVILNKNLDAQKRFPTTSFAWDVMLRLFRKDQIGQKAIWAKEGMPGKAYYPEVHFPFRKYGIKPLK